MATHLRLRRNRLLGQRECAMTGAIRPRSRASIVFTRRLMGHGLSALLRVCLPKGSNTTRRRSGWVRIFGVQGHHHERLPVGRGASLAMRLSTVHPSACIISYSVFKSHSERFGNKPDGGMDNDILEFTGWLPIHFRENPLRQIHEACFYQ